MSIHIQSRHVQPRRSRSPMRVGSIELLRISDSEWRVGDMTIPDGDAGSVLGFVECVDGAHFEVLQLGHGHGIGRRSFSSLNEVAMFFAHSG